MLKGRNMNWNVYYEMLALKKNEKDKLKEYCKFSQTYADDWFLKITLEIWRGILYLMFVFSFFYIEWFSKQINVLIIFQWFNYSILKLIVLANLSKVNPFRTISKISLCKSQSQTNLSGVLSVLSNFL